MEKVLIWGCSGIFANHMELLKVLEKNEKITIVAIVDRDNAGKQIVINKSVDVISKDEIGKREYDLILIAARTENIESILIDAKSLGIDKEKVCKIREYAKQFDEWKELCDKQRKEQITVIREIMNASSYELEDYKWMFERVSRFGITALNTDWMKYENINWMELGILQIPEEFTKYCCLLATMKDIRTAIEIGVYKGLSSYFMCAVLSRNNSELVYKMVDIIDELIDFDLFSKELPALVKCIPSTSEDYVGEMYDVVFIDADHSYDASIKDYCNIGKCSKKITAFHDIYAHEYDCENGGTVRMWQEVKTLVDSNEDVEVVEFSEYPNKWMGIGCLIYK